MKQSVMVIGLIAALCSASTWADGFGIAGQVGTPGFGLHVGMGINDSFGVRANLNTYSMDSNRNESNVDYKATIDLKSGGLYADWYPFQGGFRVSAGLMLNNDEVSLVGTPSGGTFDLNGTTYQASDLGSLTGKLSYGSKTAPYLGIGWGHLGGKSGFNFMADLGVMFTGVPDVSLNGTCNPALPTVACDQLQADIQAEKSQLEVDLKGVKMYPIISVGIGYTF